MRLEGLAKKRFNPFTYLKDKILPAEEADRVREVCVRFYRIDYLNNHGLTKLYELLAKF